MINKKITVVIGPTAIGKSDFAIKKAQEIGAQIISADAYQVYKGLDIGTGKITPEEQTLVKHHLIDIKSPLEEYSVADFLTETKKILNSKSPIIICGGTGLYIRSFLYNYSFAPKRENNEKWEEKLKKDGDYALWEILNSRDPDIASKIPYQNTRRVLRALFILDQTDEKPSQSMRDDCQIIGLNAPRPIVIDRINVRVDKMIEMGLVDEVKGLLDQGIPADCQALKGIGYKEVVEHLNGQHTYEEMIEWIKIHTRQFAKRQMTWFRKLENVEWIDIEHLN